VELSAAKGVKSDREKQIPCGNDRQKGNSKGKNKSRSFAVLRMTSSESKAKRVELLHYWKDDTTVQRNNGGVLGKWLKSIAGSS
jgi:hypothetical protein